MKLALCVFGVLVAVVAVKAGPIQDKLKKEMDECKAELKMDNLDEIIGNPPTYAKPELNCMNACVMKKIGEIVEGKLVVDKVVEFAKENLSPTDEQTEGIKACVNKANEMADECQVAGAFVGCAQNEVKLTAS